MSRSRTPGLGGLARALLPLLLLVACPGCAAIGVIAQAFPNTIAPSYKKLAGQTVGIMVWTDRGVHTDWPRIQLDVANSVQSKLLQAVGAKVDEFKDTTFPTSPASIFRYQEDHPELEADPIATIAPRFGVTRLIYIEIQSFQTRSDQSVELFRGSVTGIVKVMEIKDGVATVGYQEGNIRSIYPPKSNEEGLPALGDEKVYAGTVDAFTTEIATRFVPHQSPD